MVRVPGGCRLAGTHSYPTPSAYETRSLVIRSNQNPWHQDGYPFWGIDTSISSTYANKLHSWILYRTYVEDLSVSGRTYAEVDALDYALYEKHVLTADGRYYGDTYTDPATLP